jgi:hypothetical protein
MSHERLMTCRFCRKAKFGASANSVGFIKYGVRHYACRSCYIDRKTLADVKRDGTEAAVFGGTA